MVLNELGARIGAALAQMSNAATIDEKVLDDCLKEISNALVQVCLRRGHGTDLGLGLSLGLGFGVVLV